jgi:hypothetical protein
MTTPIRVPATARVAPAQVPAGPAAVQPARPVPAPVSARTAAAFNLGALQEGSAVPQTRADEAGSLGGTPLNPGPPRIVGPPAVVQTTVSGHRGDGAPTPYRVHLAP